MSQQHFDAFTRRAAESITRRGSLATLGGAGLAAVFGNSLVAEAKKNKTKKLKKKFKKQLAAQCQAEITQCQTFITANGGNSAQFQCCNFLATCDFLTTLNCVVASG